MSTRGFIGFRRNGENRLTYNHSDSYPSWLGSKTLEYVRTSDVIADGEAYFQLPIVDADGTPNAEQLADLKARGYWQSVSTGADWYSSLRDCQGEPTAYVRAGYLPVMLPDPTKTHDIFMEWGYVIDLDTKELIVYECDWDGHGAPLVRGRFPFDQIRDPGFDVDQAVATLEPQGDDD